MDNSASLFSENGAAAISQKNIWTKMASTPGCMIVVLTKELLIIKPVMALRWLIVLLQLDLFHKIPISQIKNIQEVGKWFGYGKLELTFTVNNDEDRQIHLYMKNCSEFLRLLAGLMKQH